MDYGVPSGTPIKAVGAGVVMKRGWAGGYGNQIIVRHVAGLESMYSHMSGYARGLSQGSRVRQGQVIGFVGSTGNSTGPHLDFRLKQNGTFINPTKAVNPRSEAVSKVNMTAFKERMELVRAFMSRSRELSEYDPQMIMVPASSIQKTEEKKEEPAKKSRRKKS